MSIGNINQGIDFNTYIVYNMLMPYKDKQAQYDWYNKWYAKNGRNRGIDYQAAIIEWKKNHPEAIQAHEMVRLALKQEQITKPKFCQKCNREPRKKWKRTSRLYAHHDDYSKPLDVLWLCGSCHKLSHLA